MSVPVHIDDLFLRRNQLKRNATKYERKFMHRLTGGRYKFRFQFLIPPYIVDFLIPKRMLVIELDGKHHLNAEQRDYDERRSQYLASKGFSVIRILNKDVETWPLKIINKFPRCNGTRSVVDNLIHEFKVDGMKRGVKSRASKYVREKPKHKQLKGKRRQEMREDLRAGRTERHEAFEHAIG